MCKIVRVSLLAIATIVFGWAARVDTVAMRTDLSTANEVPPVTGVDGAGSCLVLVHATRNDSGVITGGVVDFDVSFTLAGAADLTGLGIYEGPAGQNGGVVVSTDLSSTNKAPHPGGNGSLQRQVVVNDAALLGRLLAKPSGFYCNMQTAANASGVVRGQLSQPDAIFMRTAMSPNNEVPPTGQDAGGACTIRALVDRDASGQVTGGVVFFDVSYRFANTVDLTGLHLHNGADGENAGVVIGTDLGGANTIRGVTRGSVFKTVPIRTTAQLTNLRQLLVNPASLYCNIHTNVNPGGAMRGQMLYAGSTSKSVDMVTANEVPPVTGLNATATGKFSVYYTRASAGPISGAAVLFDVNYQGFPADTRLTGLSIRGGAAGASGDIVIDSGLSAADGVTGSAGNIYRLVNVDVNNDAAVLKALNDLLANPERFYMNLHTAANPNGAVRAQLGTALTAPPTINQGGIISAVNDATIGASPGALVSLYGTNLAQTTSDLGGLGAALLPIILNGTDVRVGLRQAPLVYVSPGQINFQIPYETDPGNAQVLVTRPDSFGPPVSINVRATAPGIFVNALGAAVLRNADSSQISATNPAAAGDVLSIFCTGLGRVTPQIASGVFAPRVTTGTIPLTVAQPTVTIGGVTAEVLASSLAPGFAGLYQVAIRMPSGVAAGNQPVVITADGQKSNAAMMAVK